MNSIRPIFTLMAFAGLFSTSFAGGLCCKLCGKDGECRKVCRLECTEKKIVTTCWSFEDEDFCLPYPSKCKCGHQECVCEDCDEKGKVPPGPKILYWREWFPAECGKVFTKRKLMKKTVTKTVPSYKWVVEELCPDCEETCEAITPPEHVVIPPAPAIENVPVIGGHTAPGARQ